MQYQQQDVMPTKTLNELEKDIILFFVQNDLKNVELKVILDMYRAYQPIEIMESIMKLCRYGFFFLTREATLTPDNYPLIIQVVMRFKRQATSYLLYYLVRQNSFAIRHSEPAVFDYKKVFCLPKQLEDRYIYKVYMLYYRQDHELWNAIDELKRKGYLIKIGKGKGKYRFRYELLPVELLKFLV